MCPSQGVIRRVRAGCSSAKLHGASSVALKSAPTHVNRIGKRFIFVEIRMRNDSTNELWRRGRSSAVNFWYELVGGFLRC